MRTDEDISRSSGTGRSVAAGHRRRMPAPMANHGFTLIELMIVVVVVAILAAVALPSYQNYLRDSRRTEGRAAVSEIANRLERYIFQCNAYTNFFSGSQSNCTGLGLVGGAGVTTWNTENSHYRLAITIPAAAPFNTYTITATPLGTQASADPYCTSLTLNERGIKGATGSNTSRCWK